MNVNFSGTNCRDSLQKMLEVKPLEDKYNFFIENKAVKEMMTLPNILVFPEYFVEISYFSALREVSTNVS